MELYHAMDNHVDNFHSLSVVLPVIGTFVTSIKHSLS